MLDVHRPARPEVAQPLLELGRTGAVGAPPVRLAGGARGHASTGRARRRERERLGVGRPLGEHDLDDIGDHVARALDQDRVAHPDVLPADLVLVMEAHVPDRHAGQLHGRELGGRRQRARLADVHLDRLDHGRRLTRGELECDGPSRMVCRRAEPALVIERLHLDHGPVGIVAEPVAVALELRAARDDRVEVPAPLGPGVRLEPGRAQRLEHVPVGGEAERVGATQVIDEDVQGPAGGDRRVLLAYGARGGITRVRERRRAGFLEGAIEPGELLPRHEDLAAHLDDGNGRERAPQDHRNGPDRSEVGRDVLAHSPVAPRGPPDEAAGLVQECDAQTVDLGLAHVRERGARKGAADPGLELAQVIG